MGLLKFYNHQEFRFDNQIYNKIVNEENYKKSKKELQSKQRSSINFINRNIDKSKNFYFELIESVERFYPNLTCLNIPKLLQNYKSIDRKDLYRLFIQYKTLLKISIGLTRSLKALKKGLVFPAFYMGVDQMRMENEDLAEKVFNSLISINTGSVGIGEDKSKINYLDWDEFMNAILVLQDTDRTAKINLFFRVSIIK